MRKKTRRRQSVAHLTVTNLSGEDAKENHRQSNRKGRRSIESDGRYYTAVFRVIVGVRRRICNHDRLTHLGRAASSGPNKISAPSSQGKSTSVVVGVTF